MVQHLFILSDDHQVVITVFIEFQVGLVELSLAQFALVLVAHLTMICLIHVCQGELLVAFHVRHRLILLFVCIIIFWKFAFAVLHHCIIIIAFLRHSLSTIILIDGPVELGREHLRLAFKDLE